MSKLMSVQETVQQIAAAISTVLKTETMILDENLQIIAGTGKYVSQIGSYEAEAHLPQEYLYKYILRVGDTYVVDDISDPLYGPEQYGEMGEICCAIPYNTGTIGIISLVAFDLEQYHQLIDNQSSICEYLRNMAKLISSFLSNAENFAKLQIQTKMLNEIVDSSSHCVLVLNKDGIISQSNKKAREFLLFNKDPFWGIAGKNIEKFWPGMLKLILESKHSFKNRELSFCDKQIRILASVKMIYDNKDLQQIVIFFDDLIEAKQNARKILKEEAVAFENIYGNCPQIAALKELASRISSGNSTVLITGESGTGKELFAKAIHHSSPRSPAPFVTINCGAIPDNLMESELFGYEDGAFTGASHSGHVGKFEFANGGTVFIDEIGELPLHMQSKLLHVIQRREIERIGSNQVKHIDIRIIAATNKDLEDMCEKGTFREDLYYRLNVIPFHVPPLRERTEDIPLLANHFLRTYAQLLQVNVTDFSNEAMKALLAHKWPGNIRELENAVEYSVNMARKQIITIDDLPPMFRSPLMMDTISMENHTLKPNVENFENNLLLQYLKEAEEGNMTKEELAKKLGISRSSLYRRISKLKNTKSL